MYPVIASTDASILYDLPFGQIQRDRFDSHPRRVARPGCGTCNCFYVACQRLRVYESPSCSAGKEQMSEWIKADLIFRQMCTNISAHEEGLPPWVNNIFTILNEDVFEDKHKSPAEIGVSLEKYKLSLRRCRALQDAAPNDQRSFVITGLCQTIACYEGFLGQLEFTSLEAYLMDLKLRQRGIYIVQALLGLGLTMPFLADKIAQVGDASIRNAADFTKLPIDLWIDGCINYHQDLYCNLFGLVDIAPDWPSIREIDCLISKMREYGPIAFVGSVGKHIYHDEPKLLSEKVGTREVYGWPVGSKKSTQQSIIKHVVTVVGAAKSASGKGVVYFLDPQDPSDPSNPTEERVYKVSLENFMSRVGMGYRARFSRS